MGQDLSHRSFNTGIIFQDAQQAKSSSSDGTPGVAAEDAGTGRSLRHVRPQVKQHDDSRFHMLRAKPIREVAQTRDDVLPSQRCERAYEFVESIAVGHSSESPLGIMEGQ